MANIKTKYQVHKQGFSLVQVSVIIAVAGVIMASMIPGGELNSDIEKSRISREKMEKIEAATQKFMATNLRRPCPANGTLALNNTNFGKEDSTPGRCSGANFYTQATPLTKTGATTTSTSAVATTLNNTTGLSVGMLVTGTNIADDTHILSVDSDTQITLDKYAAGATGTLTFTSLAAGVVPTKTLGLSDDYMFDGYGRRFGYVVDTRATDATTCRNLQASKSKGSLQILNAAAPIANYSSDTVLWSLISYGKNGHGAFSMQGASIANRINSLISNDDERINAFVVTGSTSFSTSFTRTLVKHDPYYTAGTSYFDDIVWNQESTKYSCCLGKICSLGTKIDGDSSEYLGTSIKTGDINGDGVADMIVYKTGVNTIRVIFGNQVGWPVKGSLSMATVNSSRFITITNNSSHPNFAGSVAVGDLNGDGYDDIAIGYGNNTNSYIKVFYGSATPADTNTSSISDIITLPATTVNASPSLAIGKFSSTTRKDILALVKTASGTDNSTAYVIYGASSYSMTAEAVTTTAATSGFKITTTSPGRLEAVSGIGDVNNDNYDDIIISNFTDGVIYILFGQSMANWSSDKTTAATGSTPDIVNIDTRVTAGGTEAVKLTNGSNSGYYHISVVDMNNDAYKDIIFSSGNYYYVFYGKASGSWASANLTTASSYNGTNGFRFDTSTNKPSWLTATPYAVTADINGDGKGDIILTDPLSDQNSLTDAGSSFVILQPSGGWSTIWTSGTVSVFGQVFDSAGTGLVLNSDVSKGFRIDGYASSQFVNALSVADINNDGKNDLLIGASGQTSNAGAIYVVFGKNTVAWDSLLKLDLLN